MDINTVGAICSIIALVYMVGHDVVLYIDKPPHDGNDDEDDETSYMVWRASRYIGFQNTKFIDVLQGNSPF